MTQKCDATQVCHDTLVNDDRFKKRERLLGYNRYKASNQKISR